MKIKKMSAADLVCAKMREFVVDGTWPTSQKIPSESELAEAFGVNRLTVRIALQKLNALGVLDTRVGDGTYACLFNFETHMHEISDFYINSQIMNDVLEYRTIIQLQCARLAIERYTGEELEELGGWCGKFEKEVARYYTLKSPEAMRESFVRTVDYSLGVQTQLCKMSRNELLRLSFSVARDPIRKHMLRNAEKRIHDRGEDNMNIWVKDHWGTYFAVEAKDHELCRYHLMRLISGDSPENNS